jgi:hypothetical protein
MSEIYKFVNMSTSTLSDEKMIKIKVVDLDELYNFDVDNIFSWNHLLFQNLVWSCLLKFKIWIIQTKSDEEMTKIKVVDLDELHNFVVYDLFIWNQLLC